MPPMSTHSRTHQVRTCSAATMGATADFEASSPSNLGSESSRAAKALNTPTVCSRSDSRPRVISPEGWRGAPGAADVMNASYKNLQQHRRVWMW